MVHKLCVRSLQCGLGSIDYIHSLLIMEDDNHSDTESEHFDVYSETPQESESTDSQHASAVVGPAPNPSAASNSLPWCKCSWCLYCCGLQRRCVTTFARFSKLCLDPDVLQLCIRNQADIRNDIVMITVQGPSGRLHTANLFLIVMDI